ncbi:hypothetical protein [Actinomycetospora sp. CA-053990]|uniref:hypothetical protein n=1 Tax=Actinomycetospora sp. CA-053990 TaxID=3239891 RepID=UPI003D91EE50
MIAGEDGRFAAVLDELGVDPPLRTREELAYYRIFKEYLPGVRVQHAIGRFVEA